MRCNPDAMKEPPRASVLHANAVNVRRIFRAKILSMRLRRIQVSKTERLSKVHVVISKITLRPTEML